MKKKSPKKKRFLLLVLVLAVATMLTILFYPRKELLTPVSEPLPVKVFNERTEKTEIRYVRVYKTVTKLTASEMYEAIPGNWFGSHIVPLGWIKKSLEVPRGAFYKQYPQYRKFYSFEMGQINGHTNVGSKELLMIEQWFSDGQWNINDFYDIYDWERLFPKGTVIILGCKK